ncbi:PepSY-associated TM helix domain-containing protein [Polaromonas sp. SM01]|uniref:PepSY-associated TM helix domain-containing protein n=1 Tax=Polaromonas sp. SM01 TaxID=3085630 RepID=UPI0029817A89|nr:PepSY-associated TM helix domain-containing protein [Polaromonas sp. SM01]MDW5441945.1 PepSY-associated TM helix domain-containing protein [Polaromonas sp. SM01]
MREGFRQSMAWLHTWSGLLVGWVLFLVFAAGTASYFRDEITVWMTPELHLTGLSVPAQPEVAQRAVTTLQALAPASPRWFIKLPTEREPGVRVTWLRPPPSPGDKPATGSRRFENASLDPGTGQVLAAARDTHGGEFFYRLHFDLHYMPAVWARWLVGFCTMFMLVAIVSGIVTHKRIFADFFTFRPKKGQRSWLDAHNAVAVLALPYHLMITYTGLITLMFMYMPWGPQVAYKGDQTAFFAEVQPAVGPRDPKPAGKPATLTPIAPLVVQASGHWGGAAVGRITVNNPNDAHATISLQRQEGRNMSSSQSVMIFNGVNGALLSTSGDSEGPAMQTRGVLYGLHLGRFADPLLRALFFLCGLAGCVMVATGLLLWSVKERQKYAKALAQGGRVGWGLRLVDGLNIGTVAGVPMAMAVYFWANRLLPLNMAERPQAEINSFFIAWGMATLAGLAWPKRRMWQVQLALGGALFAGVPLLNVLTTATHLGVAIPAGLWAVAGFDLTCVGLGAALLLCAWWLGRRSPARRTQGAASARLAQEPAL